jgi:hypothetical protein
VAQVVEEEVMAVAAAAAAVVHLMIDHQVFVGKNHISYF